MARAYPSTYGNDQEPNPEEWRALRGQLVELLDQVETEYARTHSGDTDLRGLADRMKMLRDQVRQSGPADRHEQALRSVKRAIDRFSDRDDAFPPSQREALESAINEIRNRQAPPEPPIRQRVAEPAPIAHQPVAPPTQPAMPPAPPPQPQAQQMAPPPIPRLDIMPRFDELGRAVGGISGRLERLEDELKAQRPDPEAMKEIADQVAQVSQVVELLARTVGETGQVRQLEEQITGLAHLITQGQQVDLSALTKRLDDVSATVERLADLQVQHVSREKELPVQQMALRESIEDSVRTVYERIELIEKNFLIAPADVHRLMDELGQVADAIRNPTPPHQLIAMVDALTTRIGEIERSTLVQPSDVRRLMDEMAQVGEALRNPAAPQQLLAVADALNSRIDEIEVSSREVRSLKGDMEAMRLQLMQRLDLTSLTQRLEDVSMSVDRMADLQARDRDDPAQQAALRGGIQSIEKSIRAIYDRIDVIEQTFALKPEDLEKLTGGLAQITEAIQSPEPPHQLVALVDALSARLGEMETRDGEITGLRGDMQDLREAVLQAVEPRLVAVETQLSALNERVAAERPTDTGVGQIEAQVRQLAVRMDQTGEQITGLARLYSESTPEPPDYEALAELVAARTYEALGPIPSQPAPVMVPALSEDDFDELERRVARLIEASAPQEKPVEDLAPMYEGIRRVDDRLQRLEDTLARLSHETAAAQQAALAARVVPDSWTAASVPPPVAAPWVAPDVPAPVFTPAMPSRPRDAMPKSPADERPLTDRAFPDLGPVKAALEARMPMRKMHPGLDDDRAEADDVSPLGAGFFSSITSPPETEPEPAEPMVPPPAFDPASITPPPRPTSSFDFAEPPVFSSEPAAKAEPSAPQPEAPTGSSSRNTFIEAARRAAQRPASKDGNANSLISRALARFQPPPAAATKPAASAKPAKTAKPEKAAKSQPKAPEPKVEPMAMAPEAPAETTGIQVPVPVIKPKAPPVPGSEPEEPFLVKHRQPILLAASVVALSFLTYNLISQRQADDAAGGLDAPIEATEPSEVGQASAAMPMAPEAEAAQVTTAATTTAAPTRVIPIVDTLETGAISSGQLQSFGPRAEMPAMPAAFKAIEDHTTNVAEPPVLDGPVKVGLPPDSVGPLDLRQAAADGDARAQFEVAAIYTEGRAVPQDLELAATWYERSAAQGFAPAQYRLGNLYENGKGVAKDLEQARLWYQRAAESGNRMSMHNLAALYASGELGKQDFVAAAGWFEKAATQGMTDSQFNLGMLYARGLGVPQNMDASYKWFALAAKSGDADAAKARDDVARSLDADAVSRLNGEIDAWTPNGIALAANYAPIGTWAKDFDPGQVIDNREVILGVQTLLSRLGYDVGTPDGVAGPKTAEAIKAFEHATGMSEIGAINPRLLAVLGSQPG